MVILSKTLPFFETSPRHSVEPRFGVITIVLCVYVCEPLVHWGGSEANPPMRVVSTMAGVHCRGLVDTRAVHEFSALRRRQNHLETVAVQREIRGQPSYIVQNVPTLFSLKTTFC